MVRDVTEPFNAKQMTEVRDFVRSYVGSAQCGMIDERWTTAQKNYATLLLGKLFDVVDGRWGSPSEETSVLEEFSPCACNVCDCACPYSKLVTLIQNLAGLGVSPETAAQVAAGFVIEQEGKPIPCDSQSPDLLPYKS